MSLPSTTDVFSAVNALVDPIARRGWIAPFPLGVGVVQLDVVGRRSGKPRPRSVLAARLGPRMVVGTVRSGSDWVANLMADDDALVATRIGHRRVAAELRRTPIADLVLLRVDVPTATD